MVMFPSESRKQKRWRRDTVRIVSVTVVAVSVVTVTVMAITVVTVRMVTVPGFEWPDPTHATVFSIRDLKSKQGM